MLPEGPSDDLPFSSSGRAGSQSRPNNISLCIYLVQSHESMFRMARIAGEAGRAHRRRAGLAAWLLLLVGVIVIMASTAAAAAADAGEAGSKEWCQEAGFNSDVLKCSTCGKMGSALPDGEGGFRVRAGAWTGGRHDAAGLQPRAAADSWVAA